MIGPLRFLAPLATLVTLLGAGSAEAAPFSAAPFSAGTFSAGPKDNRFAFAAGLGMNSGLAVGLAYSGPFIGLKALAGYLPTYTTPPGCTLFCGLDGVTAEHGAAVAADLLLPVLCDRRACLGVETGYRYSSVLGHGGGGGLYGMSLGPGWVRVSASVGVSYYPSGRGATPLFLATNLSSDGVSSVALGTQVTVTFSPWLLRTR